MKKKLIEQFKVQFCAKLEKMEKHNQQRIIVYLISRNIATKLI